MSSLLSALRESVGRYHRSKDEGQTKSGDASLNHPSTLMGGRGAILHSLWNLVNPKSLILKTNQYKSNTYILILVICVAMPSAKEYARAQVSATEWKCLEKLWTRESHWNHRSISPTDDYGIPQRHMRKNTAKERNAFLKEPMKQIDWGLAYIEHRYGSPCKAWEHSERKGWY
jgi:hypothetical protein